MGKNSLDKIKDFNWRLTLNLIIAVFLIKVFFFLQYNFQGRLLLFSASFVQDAFLLVLVYSLFLLLFKINYKFIGLAKPWFCFSNILFYILISIVFFISITYNKFISDIIEYPINIFRVDLGVTKFFFEYFINLNYIFLFAFLLSAVFFLSFFFLKNKKNLYKILIIVLLILFIPTILKPSINPVFYSINEEIKTLINPSPYSGEINKLAQPIKDYGFFDFSFLDKKMNIIPHQEVNYNKIVVLIMESVNYDNFIKQSEGKNVLWKNKSINCQIYDNYFTTNLDSYPSLFAMLYSVLFPYKAYSNDVDYKSLESNNNLVRFFNKNGFSTYFIATYNENPWLVDGEEWLQVLERKDFSEEGFVCLDVSRIDSACEDFAAMNKMIELLKTKEKVFMFHEMVYGHLTLWEKETGIEQVDYYNSFFNEFYKKLIQNNLSDNTLIVIVSDHGARINAMDVNNYHIPLVLCGSNLKPGINHNFSSHLDFKNILLKEIINSQIEYENEVYVVGSSNQWVYGKINNSNYVFINNQNLDVSTNSNKQEVIELNNNFQKYLSYFQNKIVNYSN